MTVASLSGLRRIIGATLAAAALLTAGCTAIKLAYDSAPSLTYFWINSYLDLDNSQTPRVKEELAQLHDWHRHTELPGYADLLRRTAAMAPRDVTPEEVCSVYDEMRRRFTTLTNRAEPAAAALATSLTPDQLESLQEKYAKNNKEYRKEWIDVTPEKRLDRRMKQVLERAEDFYGRFDSTQREALRERLAQSAFDPNVILAERIRRQQDAVRTLQRIITTKPGEAEARRQLHAWIERGLVSPDAAYRAYEDRLRDESCRNFSLAHAGTTPAQREKARQRLLSYEKDMRELAAR